MNSDERPRLAALHHKIRTHLENDLIPFWLERAPDRVHGGYLTNFDERGRAKANPHKLIVSQMRLLWWFARLYRRYPQVEAYRHHAEAGLDFMLRHFSDEQDGGWFWMTHRDGAPHISDKITYGQAFAIYALAEYTWATSDVRGLNYANQTVDALQTHVLDSVNGGYLERFSADWVLSFEKPFPGSAKTLNTHMHLMEAWTTLVQVSHSETHRQQLATMIDLIVTRMIDGSGTGLQTFDRQWHLLPDYLRRSRQAQLFQFMIGLFSGPGKFPYRLSYGHDIELAWLLRLALQTAGRDIPAYASMLRALSDHTLRYGVDWEIGGLYFDGLHNGSPAGAAIGLKKEFWQQAEGLVGFLDAYEHSGDERCLQAVENVWRFVEQHMIVRGVGEWRSTVSRSGSPINPETGHLWKVAYHVGRSMIECDERITRLLSR